MSTCKSNLPPSRKTSFLYPQNYLLVAAIDFGTTFSGIAFSTIYDFKRDPTQVSSKTWTASSGNLQSFETSTCILFNPKGEFESFGFEAEDKYLELALEKKHTDWYYFRRFKMRLYDRKEISENILLESENGKFLPAIKVFSASIRYLKDILLKECRKQQSHIEEESIRWVITVPAMWTDRAKSFMRQAAEQAGVNRGQLRIALEPEAAAFFIKHLPLNQKVSGKLGDSFQTFAPGSRFLVCDAGGGTVDTTVYEMLANGRMKELHMASGGDWGGTKVDEEFFTFLENLVGKNVMETFSKKEQFDLMDLYRDFEIKKRVISNDMNRKLTFKFPASLKAIFHTLNSRRSLEKESLKNKYFGKKINWVGGDKLQIDTSLVQNFFREPVSKICDHLNEILEKDAAMHIKHILLVGGFAESPLLQEAIQNNFRSRTLIIPKNAGLSVLKGAVIFGHDPSLIRERIAKYSYGVISAPLFVEGKHPEEKKIIIEGEARCTDVFHQHVVMGSAMVVGRCQSDFMYSKHSCQDSISVKIYAATSENPVYTTDKECTELGALNLDIPNGRKLGKSGIRIQTSFSGTEIEAKMTCLESGKTVFVYLDH